MFVSHEDGESVEEIADSNGLSIQTVKNTLTKARKKLTIEGKDMMEVFIIKPTQIGDNSTMKISISTVLSKLCTRLTEWNVDDLKHLTKISNIDKGVPGDIDWMNDKVFRYIDLIGTRGDEDAELKADRIEAMYNQRMEENGETEPKFGFAVLKYWLDRYYITYDIIEGE